MEASQAPSGEMFTCKRVFLEPLKSHHPGSHFGAQKRLSLTPSHTCTPTLALLLPTASLPRIKATIKLCSHPGRLCANIYIAPLRGPQQTQHGGANLATLSRPQSWPGAADTPQSRQACLAPGWGWDRMPPRGPDRPAPAQGDPSLSLGGECRVGTTALFRATYRCSHLSYFHAPKRGGTPKVKGTPDGFHPSIKVLPVSNLVP